MSRVGEGAYGVVLKVRDEHDGRSKAVKCFKDDETWEGGVPGIFMREVAALRALQGHPYIVQLFGVSCVVGSEIRLTFELADCDVRDLIQCFAADRMYGLTQTLSVRYMREALSGLAYVHSKNIMHRDIKTQNLLLGADGSMRIADFGLARSKHKRERAYTKNVVTLWYRAPELLAGDAFYGCAVDVWSLGVVFMEMLTGWPPFTESAELAQSLTTFSVVGTPACLRGSPTSVAGAPSMPMWNECKDPDKMLERLGRLKYSLRTTPKIAHAIFWMLRLEKNDRVSAADALKLVGSVF